MFIFRFTLNCLLTSLAIFAGSAVCAAEPAHEDHAGHSDHASKKLRLNHGQKWATDAALRKGMSAIRVALMAQLPEVHQNALSAEQYQVLGKQVEAEVARIVAQCKLEPSADKVLHIIIGDLLDASAIMQGKESGKPAAGAQKAVGALNRYGRFFDHPGWQSLK